MGILQRLESRTEKRVVTVHHGGESYELEGAPDANLYAETIMIDAEERAKKALHWSKWLGRPFSKSMVPHVLAVAATLRHEQDPEARYDETQIAQIATDHGALFMVLMGGAYDALGFSANGDDVERLGAAALKA